MVSGKRKPAFAKGETEARRKASSLQPAQGREGSLSGVTLRSIPLPQRPPRRSGSSCLLSARFGCSEGHFPPGLLRAPPSFAPSHLLLQLPLTEAHALAELPDPLLHFHIQNAGTFTPKSRQQGSGPSLYRSRGTLGYPKPHSPQRLQQDGWQGASRGAQGLRSSLKAQLAVSCHTRYLSPKLCPSGNDETPMDRGVGKDASGTQ